MKSLQNKLFEGFYKNAGGLARPTTKEELQNEINTRLKREQYDMNDIDTSKITDMSYLFLAYERAMSKLDVSKWDVSNVENMRSMFGYCTNFNCDLSKWDVSKVKDMSGMFTNCRVFNSDLSKWDVSKVSSMECMFYNCFDFNCDLSKWNTSSVTSTRNMFMNCTKFNCNLSKWNVSKVIHMDGMFNNSGMWYLPRWYKEH